jgi:simple sugar transport system permease protein
LSETTTARETPGAGTKERGLAGRLLVGLVRVREASILVVLVGLAIYFQAANSAFLSEQNILSLARFAVPYVVIASGLCLLLICGEIDLSVGQSFAFAPIVMYLAYDRLFLVLPLAVVVGLLAVALVGLVNGVVTVYLGVSSLITTLGMFFLLAGLNVTLTGGFPATTPETNFVTQALGEYAWSGTIWAIVIVAVLQLVLARTRWGLHTYATGGNPLGSREAGVSIARIKIGNFILCGVLGGFVGIIESFRINSIDPLAGGPDIVLLCIAAAVIGGTALLGGVGTVTGAFLGALVLVICATASPCRGSAPTPTTSSSA